MAGLWCGSNLWWVFDSRTLFFNLFIDYELRQSPAFPLNCIIMWVEGNFQHQLLNTLHSLPNTFQQCPCCGLESGSLCDLRATGASLVPSPYSHWVFSHAHLWCFLLWCFSVLPGTWLPPRHATHTIITTTMTSKWTGAGLVAQCTSGNQSLDLQHSRKHNPSIQVMEMGGGIPGSSWHARVAVSVNSELQQETFPPYTYKAEPS